MILGGLILWAFVNADFAWTFFLVGTVWNICLCSFIMLSGIFSSPNAATPKEAFSLALITFMWRMTIGGQGFFTYIVLTLITMLLR